MYIYILPVHHHATWLQVNQNQNLSSERAKKSLIVTNRPECHCLETWKVSHWHKRDKIGFEVSQGFEGFLTFAFFSWSQKRGSSENNNKIIQLCWEESVTLAILNYSSYRVKVIELVIFSFNR